MTSAFFENRIVQHILYIPSAVGQPASHKNRAADKLLPVRCVCLKSRRIRDGGDDRQKH